MAFSHVSHRFTLVLAFFGEPLGGGCLVFVCFGFVFLGLFLFWVAPHDVEMS